MVVLSVVKHLALMKSGHMTVPLPSGIGPGHAAFNILSKFELKSMTQKYHSGYFLMPVTNSVCSQHHSVSGGNHRLNTVGSCCHACCKCSELC